MTENHPNPLAFIPDYVERKGSLFLRSDHMDYGRPTLVSNWYVSRLRANGTCRVQSVS